jgi:alpha-mannosidase
VFDTGVLLPVGAVAFRISKVCDPAESDGPALPTQRETSVIRRLLSDESESDVEISNGSDESESDVEISNGLLNVTFDHSTGMMKRILTADVDLEVNQQWGYYTSFDSAFDRSDDGTSRNSQNSGAYVFRPNTPEKNFHPVNPMAKKAVFVNSSVGTDVHVSFDKPWIKQVTRLIVGKPYVEIEYTVGPIPISYGRGKEIASQFWTPIKSNGVFYTDSNGREFLQRKRNYRPSWNLTVYEPVAGNYYPVNAAMYMEDANASFAVLVDRSQGGGSVSEGQVEIMVQRRTVADDARGVDEALNETTGGMSPYPPYGDRSRHGDGVIVRGTQRIMVGPGSSGASLARSEMDRSFAEPLVFVGSAPSATPVSFLQPSFTGLQTALPPNVMLVTLILLAGRDEATFLIRLGHQYAAGEDVKLSAPVDVDLSKILLTANYKVMSVKEKTLTGNQDWHAYQSRRFVWNSEKEVTSETAVPLKSTGSPSETIVTLKPMEIRTFELTVASTS